MKANDTATLFQLSLAFIHLSLAFIFLLKLIGTCSFICQGTSTRRQRGDLYGLRVKLPPITACKVEAIWLQWLSALLLKDTTSELAGSLSHYLLMLIVKQESCEY